MKKLVTICSLAALIASCGGNDASKPSDAHSTETAAPATAAPQAGTVSAADQKGLELIGSNDCTTCHAIDHKVIGPAYIDVAKKYESTDAVIDTLVAKVKNGGSGNWGPIAMSPHPNLSVEDARTMVTYILSLKNKK